MTRRRLAILVLLSSAVAAAGGTLAARWNSPKPVAHVEPATQPALFIDSKHLNFGDVWEANKFAMSVPVTNCGDRTIELDGLRGTCSCLSIEPNRMTILPGETSAIRLTLDLSSKPTEDVTQDIRSFGVAIWGHMRSEDGALQDAQWTVRGRVKRVFTGLPDANFGRYSELDQPIRPLVLSVTPSPEIAKVEVEMGTLAFSGTVSPPSPDRPGWCLVVSPVQALKQGAFIDDVSLVGVTATGVRLPAVKIPVSLRVVPDVEAIPELIQVGSQDVGAELFERVELRSLSGRRFTVEGVVAEGEGLTVAPANADRKLEYAIRQKMTTSGPILGKVRFRVRSEGTQMAEVVVPIQGYGFAK